MAHAIEMLDADWFTNTRVYQALRNSERAMRWTSGRIKDLWLEPQEFVKAVAEILYEQTQVVDQDVWVLNYGYEGSGKSALDLMFYDEIAKIAGWDSKAGIKEDLIFMQSEYAKTLYAFAELGVTQHAIDIDDAHYVFGKYYGMTSETKSILQLARFFRDQQIIHLLNTQTPPQLFRDIWMERIGPYVYCWGINVVGRDDPNRIKTRWMYAGYYSIEKAMALRETKWVRKPLAWKKTITSIVPDYITRFDVLFPKYSDLYFNSYKIVKQFYKRFYAYLRFLGVTKGTHFEIILRLLYRIVKDGLVPIESTDYPKLLDMLSEYSSKHSYTILPPPPMSSDNPDLIPLDAADFEYVVQETVPKRLIALFKDLGVFRENPRNGTLTLDKNLVRMAYMFGEVVLQRGELLERRAAIHNR